MKPVARWLALVAIVVAILSLGAMPALAANDPIGEEFQGIAVSGDGVIPEYFFGNTSGDCFKIDFVDTVEEEVLPHKKYVNFSDTGDKTFDVTVVDGDFSSLITVRLYYKAAAEAGYPYPGWYMDYEVQGPDGVDKVWAKGAPAYNEYVYEPTDEDGDTILTCPLNVNDNDPTKSSFPAFSHISFCLGEGTTEEFDGLISARKWYDRDKDGVWDADEPALAGWKINLYMGDELVESKCTDADGGVVFGPFEEGETYIVKEELAPEGSCWFQTWPEDNAYEVTVVRDVTTAAGDFGNVCEKTSTGGYTLGYWSNKNGAASLDAYNAEMDPKTWQAFLGGYNLVGKTGADYDPTTIAAFRTWLLKADATNMSYMLSVQMAATLLNQEVKGAAYAGYGVIDMDGEWISIADLIVKANAFLADNEVTVASGAARDEAEFYKNVFDMLNNNKQTVIPFDPCDVPDFGCEASGS